MDRNALREGFFARDRAHCRRLTIKTTDGAALDAVEYKAFPAGAPWVVWFNANGVIMEQNLKFMEQYSQALRANAVAFNFRGVGDSSGWPRVSADLVTDGEAVIMHVHREHGVPLHHIVLHGHSLGGGVVGELGARFPQCLKVHDRSFASLEREGKNKIKNK